MPHESRLGFEATVGPTLGNVSVAGHGRFAVGGSAALGFPVRVTRTRDLWQQSPLLEPLGLLVPKVGFEMLAPTGHGLDHTPVTALEASIAFRYMQWPTTAP